MADIRFAVKRYLDEGSIVLPVKAGEKATRFPDWPKATPTLDDFAEDDNVALRLDNVIDVDCDCDETRALAGKLLLDTGRKHGRPSIGTTHYFYQAAEGEPKAEVFKDTEGAVLVEIRTGNSQYTLIPPSVLARKDDATQFETLTWDRDGQSGRVVFDSLRETVALLATAALLAKNWPKGSRHVAASVAAGFLISRDIDPALVVDVIGFAAELARDPEVEDRRRAARDSIATFQKGAKTTGLPTLSAIIGEDVAKRLGSWFGGRGDTFPLTEAGDAECFAAHYGERVRFDHRRGRWLLTDAGLWVPDQIEQLNQLVVDLMRERRRQSSDIADKATRKAVFSWTHAGESRKRITNTLALARAVSPIADAGDEWDCDPWLLGVDNGVIDLRTGVRRTATSADRITMRARVAYEPSEACPLWDQTVSQIFNGNAAMVDYVHRALGYSITGDMREECFFVTWGNGRNGKGTLMNTIARLLGDYADNLSFSALELHQRSGGAASPEIAKLPGKRFVTASESSEVRLNEARIKALTGRDPMTARGLYQAEFTFEPVAKFWLSSNKKPRVKDDSDGFWARVKLIPFTQSFAGRADTTLKDRLRDEEAGILAWLVRGCLAWQARGLAIDVPAEVTSATNEYRRENEPLTPFFDECCVMGGGLYVPSTALWRAYQAWADVRYLKPVERFTTQKAFSMEVARRFGESRNTGAARVYEGLGLLDSQSVNRDANFEFQETTM